MRLSLRDLGQEDIQPTQGQIYDVVNQYEPKTSDVVGAFVDDVFHGVGSASYISDYYKKESAEATKPKISKEEFEQSEFYRDDIEYYEGLTKESLKILHDSKRAQEGRDFIINRASGLQLGLGFAGALGAGIFEPVNLGVGVATAGAGAAIPIFKNIVKGFGPLKRAMTVGLAEGAAQTAITAPLNYNMAQKMQDEYTAMDMFTDFAVGTTIGVGVDVGITKIRGIRQKAVTQRRNKLYNQISEKANQYDLDPDVMYGIAGIESSHDVKAVNKNTKAFGLYQFLDETGKSYGVTRKSSVDDQIDAAMRFTVDNKKYLEKKLGRDISASETYLAHWLGRKGAETVLKADNTDRAVDVFKEAGIYKGYESKVLTQNRLPKNATIGELINSRKNMINHHVKSINPNYTPNNVSRVEEIDTLVKQAETGNRLSLDPLYSNKVNSTIEKSLKKIEELDIDYRRVASSLEGKTIQSLKGVDIQNIKPDFDIISTPELSAETIKTNLKDSGLSVKKENVKAIENAFNFYSRQRPETRKYVDFQKSYNERINDLQDAINSYKKQEMDFLDAVRIRAKETPMLRQDLESRLADIQGMKQDAVDWLNVEKRKFQEINNNAINGQYEPLNDYLYDSDLIQEINSLAKEIEKDPNVTQSNIEKYQSDIEVYKEQGLINKEMQEALDNIDRITIEEYNRIYKEAETCLLTLGGK